MHWRQDLFQNVERYLIGLRPLMYSTVCTVCTVSKVRQFGLDKNTILDK